MASPPRGPLRAFRIADRRHPLFDGTGSFLHGSRWTSKGKRVIYAAETYAGALLEILVHSNLGYPPRSHAWIEILIPDEVSVERVTPEEVPGWDGPDMLASREFGDRWHIERRSAVLRVPSVVTGGVEHNILIHQDHADLRLIRASEQREVQWDRRLFPSVD